MPTGMYGDGPDDAPYPVRPSWRGFFGMTAAIFALVAGSAGAVYALHWLLDALID